MGTHIFSLYYAFDDCYKYDKIYSEIIIKERSIIHRITTVLRIKKEESIIFWMHGWKSEGIIYMKNNEIIFIPKNIEKIFCRLPNFTFCIPIIADRDGMEQMIYAAGQQGVQEIIFVRYEKCQVSTAIKIPIERYKNILIAAAEQSKSHFIPKIGETISSKDLFSKMITSNITVLYGDEKSNNDLTIFLQKIKDKIIKNIESHFFLIIGPEGGFLENEETFFNNLSNNAISACFGKSILRSSDAGVFFITLIGAGKF